mmetsp:Transcript_20953/g.44227  ORF Transcript_20953/g.44227 Transcript_20953/m.44227 type:complete len:212 (-) Transcript_20953:70-705(-)
MTNLLLQRPLPWNLASVNLERLPCQSISSPTTIRPRLLGHLSTSARARRMPREADILARVPPTALVICALMQTPSTHLLSTTRSVTESVVRTVLDLTLSLTMVLKLQVEGNLGVPRAKYLAAVALPQRHLLRRPIQRRSPHIHHQTVLQNRRHLNQQTIQLSDLRQPHGMRRPVRHQQMPLLVLRQLLHQTLQGPSLHHTMLACAPRSVQL